MKKIRIIVILILVIFSVSILSLQSKIVSGFTTINYDKVDDDYVVEEIHNFLTKVECDTIIRISSDKLFESEVFKKEGDSQDTTVRISKQCWLKDDDDLIIQNISQRIAARTNTRLNLQEQLQVVKYDPNGFYKPHFDACDSVSQDFCERMDRGMGPRYITFIMYLNDEFEGGETFFPNINKKIIPEMGKAAIFYSVNKDCMLLQKSLHGGLPVQNGQKWIANKWIHIGR